LPDKIQEDTASKCSAIRIDFFCAMLYNKSKAKLSIVTQLQSFAEQYAIRIDHVLFGIIVSKSTFRGVSKGEILSSMIRHLPDWFFPVCHATATLTLIGMSIYPYFPIN
jgi:hypothetical protein